MSLLVRLLWVLLLVGVGGGFFGGAMLLLSTAIWPMSNLSCFICGMLGVTALSLILASTSKD